MVYSQGGNFAFNSAARYPDKVKALVALETSGSPNPDTFDFARIQGVPMLWVWGDNLGKFPFWGRIAAQQDRFRANLIRAGGTADRIVLPEMGIQGNSHMLMMDRNSDRIAGLIDRWLTERGLKK